MDYGFNLDYNSLINELTQGMEHTKKLKAYFNSVTSTSEATPQLLLQKILSSYEQSLLLLKWSGSAVQSPQPLPPTSDDMNKRCFNDQSELIDISKRSKKSQPTRTGQVRFITKGGSEGSLDDGYNWRKYGQRCILGAKFPRSYYRCKYWILQGCLANKQVQRSDDNPSAFEITYKGFHTCHQVTNSALRPTSVEKQVYHPTKQSNEVLMNLRVNTNNLDDNRTSRAFTIFGLSEKSKFSDSHDDNLIGGYSPSFVSPTTTESTYFPVSCQMTGFGIVHNLQHSESYLSDIGIVQNLHHSDSDRTDIFSTNTSTTSSSTRGIDVKWAEFRQDNMFDREKKKKRKRRGGRKDHTI
ncbi:putative WRKY transcription factor 53 isoform X2 [Nicotiana tabacum]|uniref:Probable WRKY transcription factor 41 n=1 Tax=Nicotiana tabacum TaxID=4097 RepID=A0A1S3YP12_TOBAC|nr:PREDICTED: probable WRKY transcription factor 41 [Nicotiana tabacum]